jgi:serine/threonine-protein kinase
MDRVAARPAAALPAAIGRYRILERLGKGAMGVVYRARDDQLARDVAVKLMMADIEDEPETRTRFFREAQITSKLLHRNIVTILDVGEEDGRLFIVMELLKGETLTQFLKKPSSLEQRLDLMIQACEGLEAAHVKGIVHRDIKPGNLFVQPDAGLKILDFGVARLANSSMTASGLIIGTPDYMSPEQARGKDVDGRSDVFSAAAVFYLMVTGRKPFEASNLPAVLQRIVRDDPSPVRLDEAPSVLARVIDKGLRKDPKERYQRFAELSADLIRFRRQHQLDRRLPAISSKISDPGGARVDGDETVRLSLENEATPDSDATVALSKRSSSIGALLTEVGDRISAWRRRRRPGRGRR